MKYVLIPYIALGLVLSLLLGLEYDCSGPELFPTYYGSPFVFKQKSLASSMEFFYSISGLLLNVLVWSCGLFFIHQVLIKLILRSEKRAWATILYKVIIGALILFTTLQVAIDFAMIGRGFGQEANYWYWDLDKEAEMWGMLCKGKVIIFRK